MAEVGRLAGVSQVTVSRALSSPEKVSPETLRRIRDAVNQTGYVPNAVAGALASSRSKLIAALVPSITNIFYSSSLQAFSDIMREQGYQIMLSETGFDPEREEAAIAAHLSRRPDAIMLTGVRHSAAARRMLLNAGIPVVEVWDLTETPVDCCVGFSQGAAAEAAADLALASGYRHAVTVTAGNERAQRRRDAFAARFETAGHGPVERIDLGPSATLGLGREALAQLVERGLRPGTVVFCSSDQFAHGILVEAAARGLAVPKDVAVIGFGDQDFATATEPALTTIRIDRQALGQAAATALIQRFAGFPGLDPVHDVGFELVRRGSA
ncbi:LacI family DNA-binding transcriptional regulator [Devosia sp. MSA67]|uniref:LacI family DNA-binding transcriptional regulator n=2 Tax=Devosia sediminis TaxID=2798801 RepID=A0A934ISX6_9HYPH|nr:LacI family DNA-binding transcriptional regulator [Devosia sediminis]